MDRAERRRNERAERKAATRKIPAVIVGGNMVAAELGHQFAPRTAELPEKVPGEHRFMAFACYALTDVQVRQMFDPDAMKYLDHENIVDLMIGCWDCEEPITQELIDTPCPADGRDYGP